jgi:hypothetical protein
MDLIKRSLSLFAVTTLLCGVGGIVSVLPAAALSPPTITKANMGAVTGSTKATKIVLTYSTLVKRAAQTTGPFPFSVEGYVVKSVGAATSNQIVINLAKRATSDLTVTPFVTYTAPTTNPVKSTGGVPALDQTFIKTKAVSPASAIYVSTTGSDSNPGTKAAPMATIQAAESAAATRSPIPDVYVSAGTYPEGIGGSGLALEAGVNVDGGYTPGTWKRSLSAVTTIQGTPQAVFASSVTGVTLQLVTLSGLSSGASGSSAYGLRAVSSSLTLQWVTASAQAGISGLSGSSGANGVSGGNGAAGAGGGAGGTSSNGVSGGAGGAVVSGANNGLQGQNGSGTNPGLGGSGTSGHGVCGGQGGQSAPDNATAGGAGVNGMNAASGSAGSPGGGGWIPGSSNGGAAGSNGSGGGGGGSGSGDSVFNIFSCTDLTGGGGGGGGAGGGGGSAGGGSTAGGGSFGIYLWSSNISLDANCAVSAGNGGAGGNGGNGGLGGSAGTGGIGGVGQGTAGSGAPGKSGGAGGAAGSGAGAFGGPSIGVLEANTSTATVAPGAILNFGTGGAGGAGGSNTQLGQAPSGGTGLAEATAIF